MRIKRIPRKNIRDFMGKPMIAYAITACLESELFAEVMVSTDCPQIAEVEKREIMDAVRELAPRIML